MNTKLKGVVSNLVCYGDNYDQFSYVEISNLNLFSCDSKKILARNNTRGCPRIHACVIYCSRVGTFMHEHICACIGIYDHVDVYTDIYDYADINAILKNILVACITTWSLANLEILRKFYINYLSYKGIHNT